LLPSALQSVVNLKTIWLIKEISQDFKEYWFNGERLSYQVTNLPKLDKENYAKEAVMIFVTEPFQQKLVKADQPTEKDISVLKLNFTNFITGIYPYSMMTSFFLPVYEKSACLKKMTLHSRMVWTVFVQLEN
jgi:hypothetical protein